MPQGPMGSSTLSCHPAIQELFSLSAHANEYDLRNKPIYEANMSAKAFSKLDNAYL